MTCANYSPFVTNGLPFPRLRLSGRKRASVLAACGLLFVSAASASDSPASTLSELQSNLTTHISQPRFAAAMWGVKVVSLDSGKTLFENNSQKLFSPASNSKLYTVALGLDRFGPDFRIKTSLYATSRPNRRGLLKGDLILYGRGDPTINARVHGNNIFQALEPLVAALTNAGIKRVDGNLVADESFFRGKPWGSGWAWDDLEYYYGAEISALTINDNTLLLHLKPGATVGAPCVLSLEPPLPMVRFENQTRTAAPGTRRDISLFRPLDQNILYVSGEIPSGEPAYTEDVTMHEPARMFLWYFKEALARQGVKIAGKIQLPDPFKPASRTNVHSDWIELGSLDSLPMREIAREIMKPSQNLYTDLLLAQVGEKTRSDDTPADSRSEALGIRELNKFLREIGIKKGDVLFEEGSGLSRNNLTTPNATVDLLQFMSRHKCADAYRDALPIAGVDGTLRRRMKDTAAAGNVRAKTGTLRWANSLSGYVNTAGGEHLAFSFMLNRYQNPDSRTSARNDLDDLAIMLAEYTGKMGN
jgi:serine-type D-Ala-D-Ala carboxypeptidase/endopeptidase (penicillin-binding protein 4)